jgi:hypothetical protein
MYRFCEFLVVLSENAQVPERLSECTVFVVKPATLDASFGDDANGLQMAHWLRYGAHDRKRRYRKHSGSTSY